MIPIPILRHCYVAHRLLRLTRLHSSRFVLFYLRSGTIKAGLLSLIISLLPIAAFAVEKGGITGLPIPRFASLKSSETNIRKGPDAKYPIIMVYRKKGYPVELVAEFDNWRKIKDIDGFEGWVHENLISGNRYCIINGNHYDRKMETYSKLGNELMLFRYPDEDSFPMLRAEIGVVALLKKCNESWCKLKVNDTIAWARKENLWGVYPNELVK